MAAKHNMDVSVDGSELWSEFYCCLCLRDKKIKTYAEKHCADCGQNLCCVCLVQHNRFLKAHIPSLQDKLQPPGNKPQLPSQQCSQHFGKIVDLFCDKHDVACCAACMVQDHKLCTVKYIPDIAKGFKDKQEVSDIEGEVKTLQSRLQTQRKKKQKNLQQLKKDKDDLLKEIQALRKKMNEELDKMEKDLKKETEAKFSEKMKTVSNDISDIDKSLVQISQRLKHLQDAKNDNESELFVACKLWKRELQDGSTSVVENFPFERSLELNPYPVIRAIEEGKQQLAALQERTDIKSTVHEMEVSVVMKNDKMSVDITAMCEMQNGHLVLADYSNKRLKMLNLESLEVSTLIDLSDNPFGVCAVDSTTVAVTLINQKKVQFVSIGNIATVESGFSVVDRCRSLAYSDGLLYVCCGGSQNRTDEGQGCVQVFKRYGELRRCYYEDIVCASVIAVNNDVLGPFMLISDEDKGVQLLNMDGTGSHYYTTSQNCNLPFCLLGNDHICIGECSSGNIYLQSRDTRRSNKTKLASVEEVQALHYDERHSRLIVACGDSNIVKVLSLSLED